MKLKFVFLALIFTGLSYAVVAQSSDEETEAIVNLLGVKKKQAVVELVHITSKDSVNFWKVYNAYEAERKKFAKERISVTEELANAYTSMDNKKADDLSARTFVLRSGQEKLLEQYYSKMKAATNSVLALQFYQSETYLLTLIRASIMQQIPTYGQISKLKKN